MLDKYKNSDEKIYIGELYKRYTHLVFGLCYKYLKDKELASDAVMSIFEKLIFDLKHNNIHYFKSWLYTYAKNYCLMQLRKKNPNFVTDDVLNFMEIPFSMEGFHLRSC